VAGCAAYFFADPLGVNLPPHLAEALDSGAQRAFLAAWAAHITSYLVGVLGGLGVVLSVVRERRRLAG